VKGVKKGNANSKRECGRNRKQSLAWWASGIEVAQVTNWMALILDAEVHQLLMAGVKMTV